MTLRADIQILRGIAVILVVLFHLRVPGFDNAFLGVDIFFVISGFLMYNLYKPEHGVMEFYLRRGRRLLPAYFVTIALTLLIAALIVLPIEFGQLSDQALFASLFASNTGFWLGNSYFSHSEFTPLLHLWSLGVEIQFYLVVPFILWIVRARPWMLALIIAGSLAFCLLALAFSPKTAFFMMPARVWEFGIGMMAAGSVTTDSRFRWIGAAAMALLPALLFLPVQPDSAGLMQGHPAFPALIACLVTATVLKFGVADGMFDNIAGRAVKYLGDLSYSIYLVHFPIIVLFFYVPFGGTQLGDGRWATAILFMPVILSAAWVLHHAVERPGAPWVSWPRLFASSITVALLAILAQPWQLKQFDDETRNIASAWDDRASFRCGRLFRFTKPGEDFCLFEPQTPSRETVLLIGDSHANSIKQSFVEAAHERGIAVGFAADNAPLIADDLNEYWLIAEAERLGATRIFLHYASVGNLNVPMVERARKAAASHGIATTLIMPVPVSDTNILRLLYEGKRKDDRAPTLPLAEYFAENEAIIRYIQTRPEKLHIIETAPTLCKADCAFADQDWRPYYFDDTHLTLYGAKRLEPLFVAALNANAVVAQASN